MKTVNYYYDFSDLPKEKGIEKGITGIEEGPISAEFLGIIRYNGDGQDYLITRTTKAYNDDPKYVGKLTARRVVGYESFDDKPIFIDATEDDNTKIIEDQFESKEHPEVALKNLINKNYDSIIDDDVLTVTAINKKAFDMKKMIVGNSPISSDQEISRGY